MLARHRTAMIVLVLIVAFLLLSAGVFLISPGS
jgi:regulator of protease activity HflC (stomatin/prohibitin superfamily)